MKNKEDFADEKYTGSKVKGFKGFKPHRIRFIGL